MAAIFNLCKKGVKYLRYRLCPRLNVFRMVKTTYMPILMLLTQFAAMVELVGPLKKYADFEAFCWLAKLKKVCFIHSIFLFSF